MNKIELLIIWLLDNHYKKVVFFGVFAGLGPSFLFMASDGAHPINLTLVSLWIIAHTWIGLQKDERLSEAERCMLVQHQRILFSVEVNKKWDEIFKELEKKDKELHRELFDFIKKNA